MTSIFALRSDEKIFAGVGPLKEILWVEITPVPQVDEPDETENDSMIFLPDGQSVRTSEVIGVYRFPGGNHLINGTLEAPYVIVATRGAKLQTIPICKVYCETWEDTLTLANRINAQLGKNR